MSDVSVTDRVRELLKGDVCYLDDVTLAALHSVVADEASRRRILVKNGLLKAALGEKLAHDCMGEQVYANGMTFKSKRHKKRHKLRSVGVSASSGYVTLYARCKTELTLEPEQAKAALEEGRGKWGRDDCANCL